MPAPKKRQLEPPKESSVDWLGQLMQMDLSHEDGFQIEADAPHVKQARPDPANCSCKSCKLEAPPYWDLENLEELLTEDYDFAPELDELLQDPLLSNASGFERFLSTQEAAPQGSANDTTNGQSSASTASQADQLSDNSNSGATGFALGRESTSRNTADAPLSQPALSASSNQDLREGGPQDGAERVGTTSFQSPASGSEQSSEEERRKKARMMRNRESASLSRQRKKMQSEEKENQFLELQRHCANLNAAALHLSQENAVLRQQLATVCQQTGQPYPAALLSQPPLLPLPVTSTTMAMHPGIAAAPLQKVPIRRMDAPRPAAPAVDVGPQLKRPVKKRRQAVAGGSTALAALFCLFIYCGVGIPRIGVPVRDGRYPGGLQPKTLPISIDTQEDFDLKGRSLQAARLDEGFQDISSFSQDNASLSGVLLAKDTAIEDRTLQHLKDIAPFAVLSTYDTDSQRYLSPAPWKTFEALADSALVPDGLAGPAVCKPMFDFDLSKVDDPKAAKRQLQQYLATMDMFKGRYKAMPLPPIHSTIPAIDEVLAENGDAMPSMSCGDESDYVISVMLPSKEQADQGFTQLDKMYVVVLKPNKRYIMYSCDLQRSILI